eukprot:1423357-Pyramimonas_sp.AAC.1
MPNTSDTFALYAGVLRVLQRDAARYLPDGDEDISHILLLGDWNFAFEEEGSFAGDGSGLTPGGSRHSR